MTDVAQDHRDGGSGETAGRVLRHTLALPASAGVDTHRRGRAGCRSDHRPLQAGGRARRQSSSLPICMSAPPGVDSGAESVAFSAAM